MALWKYLRYQLWNIQQCLWQDKEGNCNLFFKKRFSFSFFLPPSKSRRVHLAAHLENTSTVLNKTTTNCFWQNNQWIFIVHQQALKCCLHNAILSHSTLTMNIIIRKCNAIKATPLPPQPHLHIFLRHVSLPTHTPVQYSDNIKN